MITINDLKFTKQTHGGIGATHETKNKVTISIQAGRGIYSNPREDGLEADSYTSFEVALLNNKVNLAMPVTPAGTVSSPNDAPTAAAAADKIALAPTTIVTVLAPPVLSTTKSRTVPAVACNSAPKRVPVGNVILVPAADVDVIYPVAT